jgi:phosphatidylinositol kinase/protein kinase (PI-3  family)
MTFWSDFPYHDTESVRKQLESLVVPANGISEESLTKLTGRSSNWVNTIVALASSKVKNLDKAAATMIDAALLDHSTIHKHLPTLL